MHKLSKSQTIDKALRKFNAMYDRVSIKDSSTAEELQAIKNYGYFMVRSYKAEYDLFEETEQALRALDMMINQKHNKGIQND